MTHPLRVSVVYLLTQLGGVATAGTLIRLTSRAEVEQAVAAGVVHRLGHGRCALPAVSAARQHAHRLTGVVSHASAALEWGWEVKVVPPAPHVTLLHKRKVDPSAVRNLTVHRRDLTVDEVVDGRTSRDLTVEQCLRALPFDEALAIADSALRHGYPAERLKMTARHARGPGASRIRQVADHADGRAANPFESVLRALALQVPGLNVVPQVRVGNARPDLVDTDLRAFERG